MGRFLLILVLMCVLPACATTTMDPSTGEEVPIQVAPPTPEEVKALVYASTRLGVNRSKLKNDPGKIAQLRGYFEGAKVAMLATLGTDSPDLTTVRTDSIAGIDEDLAIVLDLTLGIVIGRVRPFIDEGKSDVAVEYIQAAIDGALLALPLPPAPIT